MTRTPWAMLMMSSTPKMSVRPTAMRAYTPPTRIPTTISCRISCAINNSVLVGYCTPALPGLSIELRSADRAGPGGLGGGDHLGPRVAGRQDLGERGPVVLPLEDEGHRGPVLAQGVELDAALDGLQRVAGVQVLDNAGVVDAAGRVDRLLDDLADRVRLG